MKEKLLFLLLFALWSNIPILDAQMDGEEERRRSKAQIGAINKMYQQGEQQLLERKYKAAAKSFEKVIKMNPQFILAYRSAGICYELLGDTKRALSRYYHVVELDPYFSRTIYYEIGRLQYRLGAYRNALDYFSQFAGMQELDNEHFGLGIERELKQEFKYIQDLPQSMLACQVAIDSIQFFNIKEVINVGPAINTKADEYFPFVSNDKTYMFYTQRKNEEEDENLYVSVAKDAIWEGGQAVNKVNSGRNEGMSTFIRNGRRMYFTSCDMEKFIIDDSFLNEAGSKQEIKRIDCDLHTAVVDGKKIQKKEKLPETPNSEYWESQAAISCDGQFLYFASNREGGFGGTDIWKCERLEDGAWSSPVNLGSSINTEGDEEAPFITNDGKMLYFSSTGHFGLGEEDIYFSRLDNQERWSTPINLGKPVNSAGRELGFFLSADGQVGYFASSREGGYGGMDIYKFQLSAQLLAEPITFVEGRVTDSRHDLPVPCEVDVEGRGKIETDAEGRFFICFPANERLRFEIEELFFRKYNGIFDIPFWENKEFYKLDIKLTPAIGSVAENTTAVDTLDTTTSIPEIPKTSRLVTRVKMVTLYYGTNESKLSSKNKAELDKFVKDLDISKVSQIEIIGYADYVGSYSTNLVLSEERAKEVANFLKDRELIVNKVHVEGKGEVNDEEDVASNRRVEVIITSKELVEFSR